MVEIMLPKNSRVKKGKVWPADKIYELRVFAGRGPDATIARIEVDEQVLTGETLND